MKAINLPEGNAFGVDDDDGGGTPYVNYAEQRAKTLFFVWVGLNEHKRVILRERRGRCILPPTSPNVIAIPDSSPDLT